MNQLILKLIKSEYVRAHILSVVRGLVMTAGAGLVTNGAISQDILNSAAGLVVMVVGFWLGAKDVKGVDEKIILAKAQEPSKEEQDAAEKLITLKLNKHANRPGTPGKTGW